LDPLEAVKVVWIDLSDARKINFYIFVGGGSPPDAHAS